MPTLFSKIIAREIPGVFVHEDDRAVVFMSIAPIRPGHALVVPRAEVDQWTDAEPDLFAHCADVAHRIGQAVKKAWDAPRAALIVAGFEVPHLHLHVYPVWGLDDFDFHKADSSATRADLEAAAEKIRAALS